MQPASVMPELSHSKNKGGFKLRKGQEALVKLIDKDPSKTIINIQFPTGYGKTISFAAAYHAYRKIGIVNRALVIVPNTTQRDQYEESFESATRKLGVSILGVKRVDMSARTVRYHRENRAEVFVVTIDQMRADMGYMHDLMSTGRWFLAADEHHHFGEGKSWGNAVREVSQNVLRTLAMSATPVRNGGELSIFGRPDIKVTLREASQEQAIKRIRANIEHYFVDVMDYHGEITRLTTESMRQGDTLPETFSVWEAKQQLRYLNKYLSPLLQSAVACFGSKQILHPGEHQMIVYAMSCKHAKSLVDTLNTIGAGIVSSDWVGVGPDGREDATNKEVIGRFKKGKLDCLVQVNKAGEGFDVCRASVIVFLNLIGNSPQAQQQIGRGLRRNYAIKNYEEDICNIFVPADSELVDLVRDMERMTEAEQEGNEAPQKDEDEGEKIWDWHETIPAWQLVSARHDRSEELWVISVDDPRVKPLAKQIEKGMRESGRPFDPNDPVDLERIAAGLTELLRRQQETRTTEEELTQLQDRVNKAVAVCASNFVKLRAKLTGGSYEKTLLVDAIKRIHSEWKKANCGHDSMMPEQFKQKYEWLQSIDSLIKTGEAPAWLNI